MNIMQMMQQAQQMQKKLKSAQEELAAQTIEEQSGGGAVTVTCDGQGKFKSIKLTPQALNPDNPESVDSESVEMLEDLITQAITKASEKASSIMETKMKALTGGINIPGLF